MLSRNQIIDIRTYQTNQVYGDKTPEKLMKQQRENSAGQADSTGRNSSSNHKRNLNLYQRSKQASIKGIGRFQSFDLSSGSKQYKTTAYKTNESSADKSISPEIDIKERIKEAENELDEIKWKIQELRLKHQRRKKIVDNLRKQTINLDEEVTQYAEIKYKNDELRDKFKRWIKEKEEIKIQMKTLKNTAIKNNLITEEELVIKTQLLTYVANVQDVENRLKLGIQDIEEMKLQDESQRITNRRKISAIYIKIFLNKMIKEKSLQTGFLEIKEQTQKEEAVRLLVSKLTKKDIKDSKYIKGQYFMTWLRMTYNKNMRLQILQEAVKKRQVQDVQVKIFSSWYNLYKQKLEERRKLSLKLMQFKRIIQNRFLIKETNYAFSIWKDLINNHYRKLMKIETLIRKKKVQHLRQAFTYWSKKDSKHHSKQTSLKLLSNRVSKQLKIKAFYGLREGIVNQRIEEFQTKIKFYKQWRNRYLQNRYVTIMEKSGILYKLQGPQIKMKQKVFNAFKLNMVKQKAERMVQKYEYQKTYIQDKCHREIQLCQDSQKQSAKQNLKKIILRWSGLKIRPYFEYWKDIIIQYNKVNQLAIYRKLKNYKLNQAFQHWRYKSVQAVTNYQIDNIKEIEGKNKQIFAEIQKVNQTNKSLADKSSSKGENKILRVMRHQIKLGLTYGFYRWKENLQWTKRQSTRLRVVLAKWKIHTMRVYFNRYKDASKKLTKYIKNEQTVQKFQNVFNERLMKKYYKIVLEFTKHQQTSKRAVQRLILKKIRDNKQHSLNKWKAVANHRQLKQENTVEMQEIESYSSQINEIIVKQSQVQDQNQYIAKCEKKLTIFSSLNLRKYLIMIIKSQEMKAFATWREQSNEAKQQTRVLQHINTMINRKQKTSYFIQWKNSMYERRLQLVKNKGIYVQKQTNQKMVNFMLSQKENKQKIETLQLNLEKNEKINKTYEQRQLKIIDMIKARKDVSLSMKLHHYVFLQWRNRLRETKLQMENTVKIVKLLFLRQSFELMKEINQEYRGVKGLKREDCFDIWSKLSSKIEKRRSFNAWKTYNFSFKQNCINNDLESIKAIKQNAQGFRNSYYTKIEGLLIRNQNSKQKFRLFQSWKQIVQQSKQLRQKQQISVKNFQFLKIRNSIIKWNKRTRKTKFCRSKLQTMNNRMKLNLVKKYFQCFRNYIRDTRNLQSKIRNSLNSIVQIKQKLAFNIIKQYSSERPITRDCNLLKGVFMLQNALYQHQITRVASAFNEIKARARRMKIQALILKKSLRYCCKDKHESFMKWKAVYKYQQSKAEIETESNIKLESYELFMQQKALEDLILTKESITKQQLEQIQNESKTRAFYLLSKSIIRMKHFNKKMFHLPKFFDILRNHCLKNKQRKRQLGKATSLTLMTLEQPLYHAFQKWKLLVQTLKRKYESMKKEDLISKFIEINPIRNQAQVHLDIVESHNYHKGYQILELKDYENKAKSIFFKYLHKRNLNIQALAISKWIQETKNAKNNILKTKIQTQNELLAQLQKRIKVLESHNIILKGENNELHSHAYEGLKQAENLQILSQERANLTIRLADKALEMRKLIEDNNNLNIRLSHQKMQKSYMKNNESMSSLKGTTPKQFQYKSAEFN